jgi:threonine dehydrogenase-like Zn-dependent dehydrogenase
MASVTATYTALCEREGDWWVITVPELKSGNVTQARTLDEVPATVADLVALMTDADPATIEVSVQAKAGPGLDLSRVMLLGAGAVGAVVVIAWRVLRAAARIPAGR